ncbi:hypothetical protein N9H39_03095 [Gammaproteobacteria bacterium]|nr:hypothetical protein [Gammaproteobacteria bacterium]
MATLHHKAAIGKFIDVATPNKLQDFDSAIYTIYGSEGKSMNAP